MLADMQRERGRALVHGEVISLGEGAMPLYIMDANRDSRTRTLFTIQAGQYLDTEDYHVLQVVLPDPQGRWPWEPGCARPYVDMPLLGELPIHAGRTH